LSTCCGEACVPILSEYVNACAKKTAAHALAFYLSHNRALHTCLTHIKQKIHYIHPPYTAAEHFSLKMQYC